MSKKTVVMIGNTAWGMNKFRADLMKEFISLGHNVVVVAPDDEWSIEIRSIGCSFIHLAVDRKGVNPFKDILYTYKLTKILLGLKADVVLAYTIKPVLYASIASWLVGVPQRIAITTGLGYTFSVDNWVSKITKLLYKYSLAFATQVWFLNSEDLSIFIKENLVRSTKTFILPGEGVNIDFYQPMPKMDPSITFTLISRMLWDKGVGLFVECAEEIKKSHPHIKFLVVGPVDPGNPEGISLETLQNWDNKGFINYLGSKNDVREVLKETSCLVHPTYYKEGLPRVLMEANAMGIPCITTDIPGCRDVIIHQKSGFLIQPKDKIQLTAAIIHFIELGQETCKMISDFSRMRALENFSSRKIFKAYQSQLKL